MKKVKKTIMKRSTFLKAIGTTVAEVAGGLNLRAAHASLRALPLPEIVATSTIILSGKIVRTEERTVREGVLEVIAFLQPDSILLGAPRYTVVATADRETREVAFRFEYGPMIPSGGGPVRKVGEDGIWYLRFLPDSVAARYGFTGGYSSLIPESPYQDRESIDTVKREIQRFLEGKKETPTSRID